MLFSKDAISCGGSVNGSRGGGAVDTNNTSIETEAVSESIPIHPLGLKTLGNQYFASGSIARKSLGNLGRLPDEMILHFLECLDPHSLDVLALTCRFLYAFSRLDELWKPLFLE